MIENTNTKQFYPGPILNNTLEITDFLFNDAEQIKIKHSKLDEEGVLRDIDLNYPTDYEVTKVLPSDINAAEAALTASTGQITLKNVNVLAGEKLTVYRVSLIIQDKDYPRAGAFPAATHEGALDYLTMQNQEQKDEIDRALKVPISTQNFEGSLPLPIPSRALKINNNGTGFEMSEFDPDLALVTTEEFKNQSQQAAIEAENQKNVATEQATIATQQAGIATEKTIEVIQAKEEAVTTIKDAETNSLTKINSEFNKANEWFERLNAIPYIPVGTILPTTGAIDESLGYQRYANGQLIANVSSQAPDLVKFLEFQEIHAPNLLCSETAWQTALTLSTLGQVGKYVWNKEEDSVRIPRIVNIQGMMDMNTVGNMIEAGLPNITGQIEIDDSGYGGSNASGAFTLSQGSVRSTGWDQDEYKAIFNFDASLSNSIYGKSNTVQEESILCPYVLQIATGVQYKTPVQNELERIVPYSFGNHKYSNVLLNNPAWMRSVGQWNSAKTHGDYYNWLVEERRNPKDIPARANVSKVGNIIDNDGVLSGFTTSNYAILPQLVTLGNNFELKTEFIIKSKPTSTTYSGLFTIADKIIFALAVDTHGDYPVLNTGYGDGTNWLGRDILGTKQLEFGKKYKVRVRGTESGYTVAIAENNSDYVDDITITGAISLVSGIMQIGTSRPRDNAAETCLIDLNESYINIDGQRWWSGIKSRVRLHTEDYGPEDWVINQSEQTFRLPLVVDRVLVDKAEGTKSYDLYSDGYLEQLVHVADSGSAYDFTVHLPKAYKDLSFAASGIGTYTNGVNHQGQIAIKEKTRDTLLISSAGIRYDGATISAMGTNVNITIHTAGYVEIPTEEQRTMNKYLYFYVGGVAKNEHLVDVGRIEEKLVDKANKSDVDGQWIYKGNKAILTEVNISATFNQTYDLSSILPNDSHVYDVEFWGYGYTSSTANSICSIVINGGYSYVQLCKVDNLDRASTFDWASSIRVLVDANRKIRVMSGGAANTSKLWLYVTSYRKVR